AGSTGLISARLVPDTPVFTTVVSARNEGLARAARTPAARVGGLWTLASEQAGSPARPDRDASAASPASDDVLLDHVLRADRPPRNGDADPLPPARGEARSREQDDSRHQRRGDGRADGAGRRSDTAGAGRGSPLGCPAELPSESVGRERSRHVAAAAILRAGG